MNLLKELALVSHSFHKTCSKHLFATIELHDAFPMCHVASSKKGFVKLLGSNPDVVKYIRKLKYKVSYSYNINNDDRLLSPILPNFLQTIPHLNCLIINGSRLDWNTLDSSLTSAFLHLMHLPAINHIDLLWIQNFPLSSLTPSVNLHRLDISYMRHFSRHDEDSSHDIVVQLEMMPKIREFHTSGSALLTTKLLHAKMQDGRPAFNFMDLRRLSMSFTDFEDERNIRYLLQNAKLLEELHLSLYPDPSLLVRLHGILTPTAPTLKVLGLAVSLYDDSDFLTLAGLLRELEAISGHNTLEALSFEFEIFPNREDASGWGSTIQNVEKVLVKPGWSELRQVSFKFSMTCFQESEREKLTKMLQSLPDKYLSHHSKMESVGFNYSYYIGQLY